MELHMQIQVNTTNMWEIELLALYVKKKKINHVGKKLEK